MSSNDLKALQEEVAAIKKALAKLGKEGISRQEYQSKQIDDLKTVIVDVHEKEKKKLGDTFNQYVKITEELIDSKNKEVEELKKKVKA